ncbi:hypothetical protein [Limimaricola cinnabarinus]|uniref:Uncharacterized protein n=1 Tax=Limimaricola cinnabarinus LL-001 TaxID=1337093 RepID=U2Z7C6_9RHOB|nr:hypothetical protein [Limimaricola cinnabarinus]GAD56957.1 hypothetical protein MBELCI_3009 [Limimaricola cinnabarinus LL-001]
MIRAVLLACTLLAGPALGAGSTEPDEGKEEAETPAAGMPPAPYALLPPEQVNAFPPEILARMRAALVALETARDGN